MPVSTDRHETTCPSCAGALIYQLGVNDGGGFRYDVWCQPCGHVLYTFSAPPLESQRMAA